MRYLAIKNLAQYQHYKDRRPPWIKLHAAVLDDYAFACLPDESKAHLMLLWLVASQVDNKIPWDDRWIASKVQASSSVDIEALVNAGFLVEWTEDAAFGKHEEWPSRYIAAEMREAVLARDGRRCVECGSRSALEIDHKIPVSRGGESTMDNLQVLCRSCNRRKRAAVRSDGSAAVEQGATQMRSPETETETEDREQKRAPASAKKPRSPRPAENYVSEAGEDWIAARGGTAPFGRIGKALKPLVERDTWPAIRPAWLAFVASDKAQYGPDFFANNLAMFTGAAPSAEADAYWRQINDFIRDRGWQHITASDVQAWPVPVRRAYSRVGGAKAIATANTFELGALREQFIEEYQRATALEVA